MNIVKKYTRRKFIIAVLILELVTLIIFVLPPTIVYPIPWEDLILTWSIGFVIFIAFGFLGGWVISKYFIEPILDRKNKNNIDRSDKHRGGSD